ncbi:unnamed protein product [Mytilus edulis]|uniref:Uncharacterized protein n=1 Tax=Mytilus edulis TaxID=6550 RepID=A0A8S3UZN5_MYTED|nr:unnamed protein product [Mytilus edulis]
MSSDSGGKLIELVNIFTGCFRRRKSSVIQPLDTNNTQRTKRQIKLPRFKDAITPYIYTPKRKRVIRKNDAFMQELRSESLLASGSTTSDNPILNICLGFKNEELKHGGPKIYHKSYCMSHWDRVLSCRKGLNRMIGYTTGCNEPIVDNLPASLWMECLEPTLSVLVTLSAMKHRRTNLSIKSLSDRTLNSRVRDSRVLHGDYNRDPWIGFIGPRFIRTDHNVLLPTEEVRPSRMLDFGGTVRLNVDVVVERNARSTRRNHNRTILTLPAHDPYEIEEDEPLAYTFPESEFDDDSDDSDIDGIFIDSDDEFVANNINQSASPNHQATGDNAQIVYTAKPITHNTNQTYISKSRLRTWRYHANFGAYTVLEADDQKLEKAKTMQKHWSEYLDHLSSGCQTDKEADELQEGLLEDPAYRRLFLKDAVLFLEDIDRQSQLKQKEAGDSVENPNDTSDNQSNTVSNDSNTNYVTPDEARDRYIRHKSSIQIDNSNTNDLTIQSVSDTSHVDDELPSLPETPIKNKQLMSDDYVICNVKPRSTESQISSGESMESICTTATDSYNDSEELSSEPLHEAVIIVTDSYVIPQHILDKHLESKQPKHFPSNNVCAEMTTSSDLLSVYADRSSEDIHSSEKECDSPKLKLNYQKSPEI